jgi:hypothetical protein
MHDNLETRSTPEIVKIWCDEYARTTGGKATVVKTEGEWIFIKTPSHEGQPWQRCHFIRAIQTLQARPDFGASIYSFHDFRAGAEHAVERPIDFVERRIAAVLNVA